MENVEVMEYQTASLEETELKNAILFFKELFDSTGEFVTDLLEAKSELAQHYRQRLAVRKRSRELATKPSLAISIPTSTSRASNPKYENMEILRIPDQLKREIPRSMSTQFMPSKRSGGIGSDVIVPPLQVIQGVPPSEYITSKSTAMTVPTSSTERKEPEPSMLDMYGITFKGRKAVTKKRLTGLEKYIQKHVRDEKNRPAKARGEEDMYGPRDMDFNEDLNTPPNLPDTNDDDL